MIGLHEPLPPHPAQKKKTARTLSSVDAIPGVRQGQAPCQTYLSAALVFTPDCFNNVMAVEMGFRSRLGLQRNAVQTISVGKTTSHAVVCKGLF